MSRVTFIGTSDAFGAGGRRQAAIFVETASGGLLLDCAPTTQHGTHRTRHSARRGRRDRGLAFPRRPLRRHSQLPARRDLRGSARATRSSSRVRPASRHACARPRTRSATASRGARDCPSRCVSSSCRRDSSSTSVRRALRSFAVHHQPESCPHGLRSSRWAEGVSSTAATPAGSTTSRRHTRGADLFVCECTFHAPTLRRAHGVQRVWSNGRRARLRTPRAHASRHLDEPNAAGSSNSKPRTTDSRSNV